MRPFSLVAAAALALSLVAGAAGCRPGPRGQLHDLFQVMPADAAARGLFYTHLEPGAPAFGSTLPLRRAGDLLGIDPDDLTDVLETGGPQLTALAGRIRPDDVAETVQAQGYVTEEAGDWTLFTRGDAAGVAGPLVAAVPAGAVRRDLLLLGDPAEVRAATDGQPAVAEVAGAAELTQALTDATAAALLTGPERIVAAAEAEGGVAAALEAGHSRGELPAWDAAALVWGPADAEADAVLLAYDGDVDGHAAASALVLRAATTPVLGERWRTTAELFERGAPRWDADAGVVRLPVAWREPDPARLRDAVEAGELLFLAPAGG